jgi:amino acid permease
MADPVEKGPPGYDGHVTIDAKTGDHKGSYDGGENGTRRRSSVLNAEVLTGEIYDDRFESTKRGLKSRHAQMIALGGTIGESGYDLAWCEGLRELMM